MPDLTPLWTSVGVTFILVCITAYYAWETRKIRLNSVRPQFSLVFAEFRPLVPHPRFVYLINKGGLAREIRINVAVNDEIIKQFFMPSLSRGEKANLNIDPSDYIDSNDVVKVGVSYRDLSGKGQGIVLPIDYALMTQERREFIRIDS